MEEFLDLLAPVARVPTDIVIGSLDEVRQGRGDQGQKKRGVNGELHIEDDVELLGMENSVGSAIQQDILASFYTSPFN